MCVKAFTKPCPRIPGRQNISKYVNKVYPSISQGIEQHPQNAIPMFVLSFIFQN